jgi:PIN domain nuclease of toxin-antitoxin system
VRLLLDTHALLWFVAGDRQLAAAARRRIEDPRNERLVSLASVWEMAMKVSLGRLRLGAPLAKLVERGVLGNAMTLLDIRREHLLPLADLPWHHRDPFDRLLTCQALHEELVLVSRDEIFDAYGVRRFG